MEAQLGRLLCALVLSIAFTRAGAGVVQGLATPWEPAVSRALAGHASFAPGDTFVARQVINEPDGRHFVRLERRHLGLRVVGDSLRVFVSASGQVTEVLTDLKRAIALTDVAPGGSAEQALAAAHREFPRARDISGRPVELVVYAQQQPAVLAWDVSISGATPECPGSLEHVFVLSDASQTLSVAAGCIVDHFGAN